MQIIKDTLTSNLCVLVSEVPLSSYQSEYPETHQTFAGKPAEPWMHGWCSGHGGWTKGGRRQDSELKAVTRAIFVMVTYIYVTAFSVAHELLRSSCIGQVAIFELSFFDTMNSFCPRCRGNSVVMAMFHIIQMCNMTLNYFTLRKGWMNSSFSSFCFVKLAKHGLIQSRSEPFNGTFVC